MAEESPISPSSEGKALFRIGEVSRLTGTKAFVLRYWETEFPTLQPVKSPSGHRLYRREDIETVFEIRRLLYEQGFTIAGARRYLCGRNGNSGTEPRAAAAASARSADGFSEAQRRLLLKLREELAITLTLLKGR